MDQKMKKNDTSQEVTENLPIVIPENKPSTEISMNFPSSSTMESLIALAIQSKSTVENLQTLMEMFEKQKLESAREAYYISLAEFQAECPIIKKTKLVKGEKGSYYYAPLDSIVAQVKGLLLQKGFSYSVQTRLDNEILIVLLQVNHRLGHSEVKEYPSPFVMKTAMMNNAQQVAATMTLAKRHAFCNAFGILTGDEDTDGRSISSKGGKITEESITRIRQLLEEKHQSEEKLLRDNKINFITQLSEARAEQLIKMLENFGSKKE